MTNQERIFHEYQSLALKATYSNKAEDYTAMIRKAGELSEASKPKMSKIVLFGLIFCGILMLLPLLAAIGII